VPLKLLTDTSNVASCMVMVQSSLLTDCFKEICQQPTPSNDLTFISDEH
jgi:hypothetical protein